MPEKLAPLAGLLNRPTLIAIFVVVGVTIRVFSPELHAAVCGGLP